MRELKFRAWDGNAMTLFDFDDIYYEGAGDMHPTGCDFIKDKIMQFTGLKDNGREVYESDLYELRVNGIETHVEIINCEVKWSNKGCGFGFFLLTKDSEQPIWIGMNDKNIISKKYLGNIHQNSDLL